MNQDIFTCHLLHHTLLEVCMHNHIHSILVYTNRTPNDDLLDTPENFNSRLRSCKLALLETKNTPRQLKTGLEPAWRGAREATEQQCWQGLQEN